jgi:hypothetical protein
VSSSFPHEESANAAAARACCRRHRHRACTRASKPVPHSAEFEREGGGDGGREVFHKRRWAAWAWTPLTVEIWCYIWLVFRQMWLRFKDVVHLACHSIPIRGTLKNCNIWPENQEVNICVCCFTVCLRTGMAQRQRAGLITPRSQDRNLLPVCLFLFHQRLFFFVRLVVIRP